MSKIRWVSLIVLLGLMLTLVGLPTVGPAHALGESWTVVSSISIGCASFATGFNVAYANIDPGLDYYQETWVEAGGLVYMDEWIGPTTPSDPTWYLYDANSRGLQTALFPIPEPATVILRLYNAAAQPIYETRLTLNCVAGTYSVSFSGPTGVALPGCDVLMAIPATAVGGTFVASAPTYWKPGEPTVPLVTIPVGNSARVIGLDASGQYYKIIWGCNYLWVPKATLGPNYDAVWNGAPLPTAVVE